MSNTQAPGPPKIDGLDTLEDLLSDPTPAAIDAMRRCPGDLLVLGVGGKMGPTLARMAKRASEQAGTQRRVIGVSRFSKEGEREALQAHGVETICCDLLDADAVAELPDAPNVIYMAGMKFGAEGSEPMTWAMNTHVPSIVADRYARSRIVAFSTGNVYGLVPVDSGGSMETDEPNPQGEYAMSCLGRERIFEHFAGTRGTPTALVRLNYACELRYGVLVDLAQKIAAGEPIDLSMPVVNVIWQGDANAMTLAALPLAGTPAVKLNLTGPETLSIRRLAHQLAERMDGTVSFTGEPSPDALLNNAQLLHQHVGYPRVPIGQVVDWVAQWVGKGGATHGKPTKFQVRSGKFLEAQSK